MACFPFFYGSHVQKKYGDLRGSYLSCFLENLHWILGPHFIQLCQFCLVFFITDHTNFKSTSRGLSQVELQRSCLPVCFLWFVTWGEAQSSFGFGGAKAGGFRRQNISGAFRRGPFYVSYVTGQAADHGAGGRQRDPAPQGVEAAPEAPGPGAVHAAGPEALAAVRGREWGELFFFFFGGGERFPKAFF